MNNRGRFLKPGPTGGFTIIEVVLVLAIAGLIFVLAFLALPTAMKTQRDNQRKAAARSFMAGLQALERYPTTSIEHDLFVATQTGDLMIDPSTGVPYSVPFRNWLTGEHDDVPVVGEIFYQTGHLCNPSLGTDPIDSPSGHEIDTVAVWVGTELGRYYCIDNAEY